MLRLTWFSASVSGSQTSMTAAIGCRESSTGSASSAVPVGRADRRTRDEHAVRRCRLHRVADVQHVGEGLRPVLPGMGAGVGADVVVGPVRRRRPVVVPLQRGRVVQPLVAEDVSKPLPDSGIRVPFDEHLPVPVAGLVPHVTEQGAVGLGQLLTHRLAVTGVALGQVDGDHAVVVAGRDRLLGAGEQVERQPVSPGPRPARPRAGRGRRAGRPAAAWPPRCGRTPSRPAARRQPAGFGSARSSRTGRPARPTEPANCTRPQRRSRTARARPPASSEAISRPPTSVSARNARRLAVEADRGAAGEADRVLEERDGRAGWAGEGAHGASTLGARRLVRPSRPGQARRVRSTCTCSVLSVLSVKITPLIGVTSA